MSILAVVLAFAVGGAFVIMLALRFVWATNSQPNYRLNYTTLLLLCCIITLKTL